MLLCAEYVIPVTADPIEGGAVLVRGNRIADIGPADQLRLRYAGEEVVDLRSAALLPGFVNTHAHVEYSVLRGMVADKPYAQWLEQVTDMAQSLNAATLYDSALVGGMAMAASGTTCVGTITQSESTVAALRDLGLRGVVYREVSAMDGKRVDYAMRSAAADIEHWRGMVDESRLKVGIASAPLHLCHPEVFRRVAQFAGDSLPVAMHIAGSREEYDFVFYGRTPFSVDAMDRRAYVEVPPWLPTGATPVNYVLNWDGFDAKQVLAVHAVHVTDDDIAQLRQYGVDIAFCPRANAFLGMGVAPVGEYLRAGLHVGIGTDSPAATDSSDLFNEMRTALQVQRSAGGTFLTSEDVLAMVTIEGARALGLGHELGSLEVGKLADIVAVDLSGSYATPTNDPAQAVVSTGTASDVVLTMIDGHVVYDHGHWELGTDVAASAARLVKTRTRLRAQYR